MALEKLKQIDRSLEVKVVEYMKIKNKELKKELMTQISECKSRSHNVIQELRNLTDLSNLSNVVIAKFNDLAYKGINKAGLQKMLDIRAVKNEELF